MVMEQYLWYGFRSPYTPASATIISGVVHDVNHTVNNTVTIDLFNLGHNISEISRSKIGN